MTDNEPEVQEVQEQAQPRPDAPGARILKITSILLIIFGGIMLIYNLWAWGGYILSTGIELVTSIISGAFIIFFFIAIPLFIHFLLMTTFITLPVLQIIAGITGKRNYHNIEESGRLLDLGRITLFVAIVYSIIQFIYFGRFFFSDLRFVISLLPFLPAAYVLRHLGGALFFVLRVAAGLALPIAYMYGTHKNLKAWKKRKEKLAM